MHKSVAGELLATGAQHCKSEIWLDSSPKSAQVASRDRRRASQQYCDSSHTHRILWTRPFVSSRDPRAARCHIRTRGSSLCAIRQLLSAFLEIAAERLAAAWIEEFRKVAPARFIL